MPSKFLTPGTQLYEEGHGPLMSIVARDHDEARAEWLRAIRDEDGIYDFTGPVRVHSEWVTARRVTDRMIEDGEVDDSFSGGFVVDHATEGARGSALTWHLGAPRLGWSCTRVMVDLGPDQPKGYGVRDGQPVFDWITRAGDTFRGTETDGNTWLRERQEEHATAWIREYDSQHELVLAAPDDEENSSDGHD